MREFLRLVIATLLVLGTFMPIPRHSAANISEPPWSSTFNCPEWDQTQGLNPPCDGLLGSGGQFCAGTTPDQITTAANFSGGGGARGFRHYIGDGQNVNGGGLHIAFATPLPEFYFRWYMRYSSGFKWSFLGYQKLIYPTNISSIMDFVGNDWSLTAPLTSTHIGDGWFTSQAAGGTQSTGVWHWYETHYKRDTNGTDGIWEVWVDGVQLFSMTNVNHGAAGRSFNGFGLLTNQNSPNNGGCVAVDLDDFALYATGPIGPVPGSTLMPAPPTNLRVQ